MSNKRRQYAAVQELQGRSSTCQQPQSQTQLLRGYCRKGECHVAP